MVHPISTLVIAGPCAFFNTSTRSYELDALNIADYRYFHEAISCEVSRNILLMKLPISDLWRGLWSSTTLHYPDILVLFIVSSTYFIKSRFVYTSIFFFVFLHLFSFVFLKLLFYFFCWLVFMSSFRSYMLWTSAYKEVLVSFTPQ